MTTSSRNSSPRNALPSPQLNIFKVQWLQQYIPHLAPGSQVLDLGAGMGLYSQYMLQAGFQVSAVDHIRHLSDDKTMDLQKVHFIQQSLEEALPFPSATFDLIMAWDIIEHVANEEQLLQEIHRILRPGGLLFLSVPHADDSRISSVYLTYAHHKDKTHQREYLPQELQQRLASKFLLQPLRVELVGGGIFVYMVLCFIDSKLVKFITKVYLWLLKKTGFLQLKNCHGDIFGVFKKI